MAPPIQKLRWRLGKNKTAHPTAPYSKKFICFTKKQTAGVLWPAVFHVQNLWRKHGHHEALFFTETVHIVFIKFFWNNILRSAHHPPVRYSLIIGWWQNETDRHYCLYTAWTPDSTHPIPNPLVLLKESSMYLFYCSKWWCNTRRVNGNASTRYIIFPI
jgi:hypothetical protein